MYDILDLYQEPHDPKRPVVGVDERPKQLIGEKKKPIPMKPGSPEKMDYEYVRNGSVNIFVAVDHKRGKRDAKVTDRRTKKDFARYIKRLIDEVFLDAEVIRLVVDNLNTHNESAFYETFKKEEAERILSKIEFHYTPIHGSWLNVAEIEISAMDAECTGRRIEDKKTLIDELLAWTVRRNKDGKKIDWRFTKEDADRKLSKHYVS
ncbi:transposase [candidate division MSBL1 archaeon SCGC-AAA259A05]|uniref:Transposase n=1 Tax=candidate division MSBL1 archaeon SCGC-AAA259A05 TaxID=1698259 RepID=A0A133U581_9EURY|nr:transposase [candidate division MSBL1 archaeon SCGC-AAA259A05]